jgi:hypothetical protein
MPQHAKHGITASGARHAMIAPTAQSDITKWFGAKGVESLPCHVAEVWRAIFTLLHRTMIWFFKLMPSISTSISHAVKGVHRYLVLGWSNNNRAWSHQVPSQRSIELSKTRKTTQNQCTGLSAGITHHRAILSYSPCIDMALYGLCDANATLLFNASG